MRKKTLQELTFKSNFIFGTSLTIEPANCAGIIERAVGIAVEHVEVSLERSILHHPGYKGVRLDVYAKDANHTHYDVEMQVLERPDLGKRARYYHSQMDMELLQSGKDYTELPNGFVIFICDFDPFGYQKYRYTFENICHENHNLIMGDGCKTIFLSTHGKNDTEVPKTLVKFLDYVRADLEDSKKDFDDDFVRQLQNTVQSIKTSREMEGKYMLWEEMIRDEVLASKVEDIFDLLEELGTLPDELYTKISKETDLDVLKKYLKLAAKADSINEFAKSIS